MDETSLFADNMGTTTLARKGSKEVNLKTAGHEKNIQTTLLSIIMIGQRMSPSLYLRGKEHCG